jgi:adenosylcobinamide-GDP ribazoletransferase
MPLPSSLRIAIGFLTRLPVEHGTYAEPSFGRALAWFPLVGTGLGVLLLAAQFTLQVAAPMSDATSAVALCALWAALSGGLHLDGLADVFDGLSGGRGDRDRTLEIMRDSHIGAHGATALCLLLIAKVVAVSELLAHERATFLLLCPAVARWIVVALIAWFPYAREEGIGTVFRRHVRARDLLLGSLVIAVMMGGLGWLGLAVAAPVLVCAGVMLLVGFSLKRRLGGLTGDVYGAAIELGELAFLLAVS